jgi:hypothetical protein
MAIRLSGIDPMSKIILALPTLPYRAKASR